MIIWTSVHILEQVEGNTREEKVVGDKMVEIRRRKRRKMIES